MSLIPFPFSANFRFQNMGYVTLTSPELIKNGLKPDSDIVKRSTNFNYQMLKDNLFAYVAFYILDLETFVNPTFEKLYNIEIVAHDQIRLNYQIPLNQPGDKLLTPGDIFNNPAYANKYSRQYGKNGIQLKVYETFILNAILGVMQKWPVNMSKVDEFHPEYEIGNFTFIDLSGQISEKTVTYGAFRYTDNQGKKKVLFWGAGLKEIILTDLKKSNLKSSMHDKKGEKMSIILQPILTNYLFQTLGTYYVQNANELKSVNPNTKIIKQLQNSNYYNFERNEFRYMFVFNFTLEDFINAKSENVELISNDQIRLNFHTSLVKPNGQTITLNDIRNNPRSKNTYSVEFGTKGITLEYYVNTLINTTMPQILKQCPTNMKSVNQFNPEYYLTTYDFTSLDGELTKKTSNVAAIKYTKIVNDKPVQYVLLFGAGLQEIIV